MHPKIDPGAMSEKGNQKVANMDSKFNYFGSNFPSKVDEQIDAEKVTDFDEKLLPK
jgi:hypothetical protein